MGREDCQGEPRVLRSLGDVSALRYVSTDNALSHRAIVEVFHEARQHYVIELRSAEVLERLRQSGLHAPEITDPPSLERHLDQLVAWGNLAATHDSAAVTRLEDFYRRRLLYHLTAVGEAAHGAVAQVEATAGRSGSLQATMLHKIRDALDGLTRCRETTTPESVFAILHDLFSAFDTLSEEANCFIGELDRSPSVEGFVEDRFVLYKQALLAYIQRFLDQLRRLAAEIGDLIAEVERLGVGLLIERASRAPDVPPLLGDEDPAAAFRADRHARWDGVRIWFRGDLTRGIQPTVERLRDVAVDAIIGLARTLGRLNDRRIRPVDRAADFRTLARWFEECGDDAEAHGLWHMAFGLGSARHFHLARPIPSWWRRGCPGGRPRRSRSRCGCAPGAR